MPHLTSPLTSDTSAPDPVARAGASTARSAGATLAAAAMTCGGVALGTRTEANSVPAAVTVGAVVVAVALTVALVASLRRTSTARRWALVALGLSMAASAYAGWQAWRDVSGGMPTRTLPLLAGATALAVASSLALTIAGGQTTRPRRTGAVWSWIAGVTAGLLAVFLVVGAVIGLGRLPLDHHTAAPVEVVAPSTPPRQVAWTWQTPSGWRIDSSDVVPAGAGIALRLSDGVVALDGRTGQERWRYRRIGAHTSRIAASPSGAWVMVTFHSSNPHTTGGLLVALDGVTGQIAFEKPVDGDVVPGEMTDHAWLGHRSGDAPPAWFSAADGSHLWDWQPPPAACGRFVGHEAVGTDAVLTSMVCVRSHDSLQAVVDIVVVALDDRTGQERWRFSAPLRYEAPRPGFDPMRALEFVGLSTTADRTVAKLEWHAKPDHSEFTPPVLLDVSTGAVLASGDWLSPIGVHAEGESVVTHIDSNYRVFSLDGALLREFSICPEPGRPSAVIVADAVVAHCPWQSHPSKITVVPLTDPQAAYAIEADLGVADDLHLLTFPAATVAIANGGRVAGLW